MATKDRFRTAWDTALDEIVERPVSIIEFAEDPRYCNLPLYPNQRIILKLYNNEILSRWEVSVVNEWIREGYCTPDFAERVI